MLIVSTPSLSKIHAWLTQLLKIFASLRSLSFFFQKQRRTYLRINWIDASVTVAVELWKSNDFTSGWFSVPSCHLSVLVDDIPFSLTEPPGLKTTTRYFNVIGSDPDGRLGAAPRPELRQYGRISGACFDAAHGIIPELLKVRPFPPPQKITEAQTGVTYYFPALQCPGLPFFFRCKEKITKLLMELVLGTTLMSTIYTRCSR